MNSSIARLLGIWSFLSYSHLSVGTIEVWIWLDDNLRPSSNVVMVLSGRYLPCGCTFLPGDSSDVARHFPVAMPGLHWEDFPLRHKVSPRVSRSRPNAPPIIKAKLIWYIQDMMFELLNLILFRAHHPEFCQVPITLRALLNGMSGFVLSPLFCTLKIREASFACQPMYMIDANQSGLDLAPNSTRSSRRSFFDD